MQIDFLEVARIKVSSPLGRLTQTHQTLADGNTRIRNFGNISETLEEGESPTEAAQRGLYEELGLAIALDRLQVTGKSDQIKPSPSTGQLKAYRFWDFALEISIEEAEKVPPSVQEGDVKTHFTWR